MCLIEFSELYFCFSKMLTEEDKDQRSVQNRRAYSRSVSWTDRSPTKSNSRPFWNSKARACLPPLQPLSIARPKVEEWPSAGSDDLGIWPCHPPTPGVRPNKNTNPEQPPKEFQFKKDKLAFFDKKCSRIVEHIYLGSDVVAKNREILRDNGITHVLNCVGFVCPEYFRNDLVYKTLWLQDNPSEDITSILYDVFDYFEDVREQGGRVLVHCCQGVSRSTSLVIAYLMWKEEQSFEDAFQRVKAARGVTNPNMGFACQLLQCQKRVHASPTSPNSVLRMYRMAPHSSYDPLHLVPKIVSNPGVHGLDSRGAFVVHVPSAIYVWIGKSCVSMMSDNARVAAFQVKRYEMVRGPVIMIKEGEESCEFWDAIGLGKLSIDSCKVEVKVTSTSKEIDAITHPCVGQRKVENYDLDFEIFHEALAGGVVPPFPSSDFGSETCLPSRENGWGRLRHRFSSGVMKRFITSSKLNANSTQLAHGSDVTVHSCKEESSSPPANHIISSPRCNSPDSLSSIVIDSPKWIKDTCDEENSPPSEPFELPMLPRNSSDSFSCFFASNQKFNSISPSLSPSTSDYSGSFSFSPSSSSWSDLSLQPSPSGLESTYPYYSKYLILEESSCLPCKRNSSLMEEALPATNHAPGMACSSLPSRGISPSIKDHKFSGTSPSLILSSVDDSYESSASLVRSCSFSLVDLEDDTMNYAKGDHFERDYYSDKQGDEMIVDAVFKTYDDLQTEIQAGNANKISHCPSIETTCRDLEATCILIYQWPSMDKVEMRCPFNLDSKSVFVMLVPNEILGLNNAYALYIWVGRDVPLEKAQNQFKSNPVFKESHSQWETIGHDFIVQHGLPADSLVQMIREGEEPEDLLKRLHRTLIT